MRSFLCSILGMLMSMLLLTACGGGSNENDDSDPPPPQPELPQATIDAPSGTEGDSGTQALTFTVTLSEAAPAAASLHYATADDDAVAGEDYRALDSMLEFASGETSKTISVDVFGDQADETDERFTIHLDQPQGLTLADATSQGTIEDDDITAGSGLAERPSNTTCLAGEAPGPVTETGIRTEEAFPELPGFNDPVALTQAPGDADHWYVVEKVGRVLRFANKTDVSTRTIVIDISGRVNDDAHNEAGLLGMAFHPDFETNGEVYLSYTNGSALISRISRFTSSDGGLTLGSSSEQILLTLDQPFGNHNGGNVLFGPDGYLYIGFGDGGSAGDPGDRAQDTRNLFGSILRINVDSGTPYGIPTDNPFGMNPLCSVGEGAEPCPEIYAWGFRNPWRWSFDSAMGDLWVGDVGQNNWEEVDKVELNGNYGWRCREGAHNYDTSGVCPTGLIDPIIEYTHGVGFSITGGYVYHGSAIPELQGRYVFADLNGKIFADTLADGDAETFEVIAETGSPIVSFAEDENGELMYIDYGSNSIRRIVPAGDSSGGSIPGLLSETGCVDPDDPTQPATGLIPYEPIVGFWSDGAAKERWYALPDAATIDVAPDGDWLFPVGSVLVKNFQLGGELIETRLFMHHTDGSWAGYTYEWNDAGTEAVRVIGGKQKTIAGQDWIYPSGTDCMTCHTQAAGYTLGPEHAQLNSDFTYAQTGLTANQLSTADAIAVLSAPLADVPENLPRVLDSTASSAEAARAYLHANCSNCHRPAGTAPSDMDLRYSTTFAETQTCNAVPTSSDLGIPDARIIAPGDSSRSLLVVRPSRRDIHGMPPLASSIVDADGVALLTDWIEGLTGCP